MYFSQNGEFEAQDGFRTQADAFYGHSQQVSKYPK